jgi:hypothetical protein
LPSWLEAKDLPSWSLELVNRFPQAYFVSGKEKKRKSSLYIRKASDFKCQKVNSQSCKQLVALANCQHRFSYLRMSSTGPYLFLVLVTSSGAPGVWSRSKKKMVSFFCCFSQTKQKLLTATPKP